MSQRRYEKDEVEAAYKQQSEVLVEARKECEELKKNIEGKMRERDLLNKDVVDQEDLARINNDKLKTLENEKTKLNNKIAGYKAESEKLSQKMWELDNEKEKYGIEASQCNAKYYHCLEQVKLKKNMIAKLQKKVQDAEKRLKEQQSLYNSVVSDRALYAHSKIEN